MKKSPSINFVASVVYGSAAHKKLVRKAASFTRYSGVTVTVEEDVESKTVSISIVSADRQKLTRKELVEARGQLRAKYLRLYARVSDICHWFPKHEPLPEVKAQALRELSDLRSVLTDLELKLNRL